MNVTAERVGRRAAKSLVDFISHGAPVGRHLADQLLLPLAIAGGGSFTCGFPDDHLTTNQSIIEAFLPTRFTTTPTDRGCRTVTLS